jgi:Guanosine polyphosphate pyrophosphohydrolases/synthetases
MSENAVLSKVQIDGAKIGDIRYAHCCSPQTSDEVCGFTQKDHKIAIHKKNCPNVATLDQTRLIPAAFKIDECKAKEALFDLIATDRIGLLAEILNLVSEMRLNVSSINTKPVKDKVRIIIGLQVKNEGQIPDLLDRFSKIIGVHESHLMNGKHRVRKKPRKERKR